MNFFSEEENYSVSKFESMLQKNHIFFFDVDEFEEIIEYYLELGKMSKAKHALQIGLNQHPSAISLKLLQVEVMIFEDELQQALEILNHLEVIEPSRLQRAFDVQVQLGLGAGGYQPRQRCTIHAGKLCKGRMVHALFDPIGCVQEVAHTAHGLSKYPANTAMGMHPPQCRRSTGRCNTATKKSRGRHSKNICKTTASIVSIWQTGPARHGCGVLEPVHRLHIVCLALQKQ